MSASVVGGPSNGHLSPVDAASSTIVSQPYRPDSDVSDVDASADQPSPSPSDNAKGVSNHVDEDQHMSESNDSSPDNASDDGDFDMQDSPPSHNEDAAEGNISSTDSNRASKRKASLDEDEYIKANPELYGLRRSVRR